MQTISRKALLRETFLKASDIRLYQKPGEDFEGFGVMFGDFSEVAQFFTNLGIGAGHNEHSTSTNSSILLDEDARALADAAQCDYIPSVGWEVYFPGWELTND